MAYKRTTKSKGKSYSHGNGQGAWARYDDYTVKTTQKLIAQMEEGRSIFQVPWVSGAGGFAMPYNALTGKCYNGGNVWILLGEQMEKEYPSAQWITYKQGQSLGGNVRKGEHGIQLPKWIEAYKKDDDKGQDAGDQDEPGKSLIPVMFTVFNRAQFDGLAPEVQREIATDQQRHELCEQLIKDSGVPVNFDGGSRAFYRPSTDSVHLPEREKFISSDGYYATVLHELGHATGAKHRLNRDLSGKFGSEQYAKEELRAELGSLLMGDRLQIGHSIGQHAAYVQSWIKILKDDPKEIWRAAKDAEAICTHLGVEKYQRQIQEVAENTQAQEQAIQQPAAQGDDDWSPTPVRHRPQQPQHAQEREQGWDLVM